MEIIEAKPSDAKRIREIHLAAFGDEGESVAGLTDALFAEEADPRPWHLVAVAEGALIGHVSFSSVGVGDQGQGLGSILAPLAVDPAVQKKGAGSALVREGLRRCREQGDPVVFVYGDPAYYGRFGFAAGELTEKFLPPCPAKYPFGWQALEISACELPEAPVAIQCVAALNKPDMW